MRIRIKLLYIILLASVTANAQQVSDLIMKANALAASGKGTDAEMILTEAINKDKSCDLFLARAENRISAGRIDDAVSDLKSANDIKPLSGEYGLSRIYAMKGNASESMQHLELSMGLAERKKESEIMLDKSFERIENSPEWRKFWKKEWYSAEDRFIAALEHSAESGKQEEAAEYVSALKALDPSQSVLDYSNALFNYSSGKYQEAAAILVRLSPSVRHDRMKLLLLAKAQMASSNYSGASDTFSTLITSGSTDATLYLRRAECYGKTGEFDKAVADAEKFHSFYPDSEEGIRILGKLESLSGDNLKALKYFSDNLKLHPSDPQCYIDRGNAYFNARSWDWAINDYSMSLDLKPEESAVWLSRGMALLYSGKTEDACHDFRKSLSLGNKKATEYISRNCIK